MLVRRSARSQILKELPKFEKKKNLKIYLLYFSLLCFGRNGPLLCFGRSLVPGPGRSRPEINIIIIQAISLFHILQTKFEKKNQEILTWLQLRSFHHPGKLDLIFLFLEPFQITSLLNEIKEIDFCLLVIFRKKYKYISVIRKNFGATESESLKIMTK